MAKKRKSTKSKRPQRGADGKFHIRKYVGLREDGSRYYKTFEGFTLDDIEFDFLAHKREFAAGLIKDENTHGAAKERPVLTLGDAIDKYIDTCRVLAKGKDFSHSTIPGYKSIRNHAFQDIIDKPVDQITVDDIQTSLDKRATQVKRVKDGKEEHLSPKTIKNEFYLLKPVLDKYAPNLNLKTIKIAKKKKRRAMVLNNSDAPAILKAAHDLHPEFFVYTLLTMNTGMRPSEVYALTWGDVSARPEIAIVEGKRVLYGEINVQKAKVMNEDRVYAEKGTKTEAGERVLKHAWSLFETIYSAVPRGEDDEPMLKMTPRRQQYYWDKLRTQLGLPDDRRFYDLRHYHCSVMVAEGAPEDYIAADMGHSTIQMAHDVYIELIGEKQRDIFAGVATHVDGLIEQFNALNAQKPAQAPEKNLMLASF